MSVSVLFLEAIVAVGLASVAAIGILRSGLVIRPYAVP